MIGHPIRLFVLLALPVCGGASQRNHMNGLATILFNTPRRIPKGLGWRLVLSASKRRDPNEDASERLRNLENIMLNVVASQAKKIKELQLRTQELEQKIDTLRVDVSVLKELDASESNEGKLPSRQDDGGFLAEEAFAAFADVLLRSSISDSNRGSLASLIPNPGKLNLASRQQDKALSPSGDVDIGKSSEDDISERSGQLPSEESDEFDEARGVETGSVGNAGNQVAPAAVAAAVAAAAEEEDREMRIRSHQGRLREALDVPDDLYDAADSSGSALLAALLCGHRRMLVDVADTSLDWTGASMGARTTTSVGSGGSGVGPGSRSSSSSDGFGGVGEEEDGADDLASERLARFVELMALPIMAALEGLDESMERSRVHIMFHEVRQLAAARRVMTIATESGFVGLGALTLDSSVAQSDAVLIIVAPVATEVGTQHSREEGGGANQGSCAELTALLKEAENRTIIVVNPEQSLGEALFAEYEPVYVLKGMQVHYQAKRPNSQLEDHDGSEWVGKSDDEDGEESVVTRKRRYYLEEEEDEWAESVWGESSEMLGDFYSDEREAQVVEQELGLGSSGEVDDAARGYGRDDGVTSEGVVDSASSNVSEPADCPPTLRTEQWVAAAAAAVAASAEESGFEGFSDLEPPSRLPLEATLMDITSDGQGGLDDYEDELRDDEAQQAAAPQGDSLESVSSEARGMLLREFPMPWRTFLQLSEDSRRAGASWTNNNIGNRDGEEGPAQVLEQPWAFVESFEGKPSRSDVNLAIFSYIDEAIDEATSEEKVEDIGKFLGEVGDVEEETAVRARPADLD